MSVNPHHALEFVPVLVLVLGAVSALVGLPLIAHRVPRNIIYGIRTPLAFSSDENWYRVNAIGGKFFLRAGLATIPVGLAGLFVPGAYLAVYACAALVLALIFNLAAVVACLRIR